MEKPTENANFQSKLEELANFAESILQGTNESYKKELWNKVGLLFIKGFDSHLPSSKMGVTNKKAKKELMDLPDEIWIRILGFLKKTDVFKSFALTCKHFNRLSLDPSIIKSLTLEKMDYLDHEHVIKVLKRSKFLKTITLRFCKSSDSLLSTAFKYSSMLKSVQIKDFYVDKHNSKKINRILETSGKNLEALSLCGYFSLEEATIKKLINLKILHLELESRLTSKNLITLSKNCKLESLHAVVTCDGQTNKAFKTLLHAMGGSLKDLKIVHYSYQYVFLSWTKYLTVCQSLEKIRIEKGPIVTLKDIAKLSNLKSIHFENIGAFGNHIEKSQIMNQLFDTIDFNTIEELGLPVMDVSQQSLEFLANRNCPSLKHICFRGCINLKFDDETLKRLISNSPQLKEICLSDTFIRLTDEQLYQLMEQSRVRIGIGNARKGQLQKYVRYQNPGNENPYLQSEFSQCYVCKYDH